MENRLRERGLPAETFVERRKKEAEPVLEEFRSWLEKMDPEIVPSSRTGQAITHTVKEWDKLVRYPNADFLTPDNNEIERAIRPFVIGRKNWLFSNTPRGAHASAAMYSIIESAKLNGFEPYHYLRFLFTNLPLASGKDSLRKKIPTLPVTQMKSGDVSHRAGGP